MALPVESVFLNRIAGDSGEVLQFVGLALLTAVAVLAIYHTRRLYLALAAVLAVNLLVALGDAYAFLLTDAERDWLVAVGTSQGKE